jgi:hypothetical protein
LTKNQFLGGHQVQLQDTSYLDKSEEEDEEKEGEKDMEVMGAL